MLIFFILGIDYRNYENQSKYDMFAVLGEGRGRECR